MSGSRRSDKRRVLLPTTLFSSLCESPLDGPPSGGFLIGPAVLDSAASQNTGISTGVPSANSVSVLSLYFESRSQNS